MKKLLALLLIVSLSACSAQWHLQKAIKKDPSILQKTTEIVVDTVVTDPIVVRDTVITSQIDTVEVVKDKFRVRIIRSYDTLTIDGGCDTDTIVRTIEVPVEKVVYQEESKVYRFSFYLWLAVCAVAIVRFVLWDTE